MDSGGNKSRERFVASFKLAFALVAPFCAAAMGYLIGIRQSQATTGAPQRTYELNIGQMHFVLTAGVLGATVAFTLAALLSTVIYLSIVAGRRRTRADEANRKLEIESRLAEERFAASEAQFQTLANAMPQLCWIAHADGWIFWYNQRWYEYTGTTPAQMDGWGWQSVHDPNVLPKVLERWKACIATAKPFDMIFPLRRGDGEFHPFLTRVMPVCDQSGKVSGWFGTNTDISEQLRTEEELRRLNEQLEKRVAERTLELEGRKRAEEARRVSDARHRALFDYAPDGIVIADPKSYYLDANSSMCRMLGYTREELVGLHASDIVLKDELPLIGQALNVIKTKSDYHREWQFRRKDGSVFSADVMATMMPDGNLLGLIRDITEQKKMEEQLRVSQRMEAIGRLAGGVAHDFNNLLAVILGCSDVMLDELAADHPAARRAEMIRKTGASAADLTRQLLAFSRQQMLQPQVLDLRQIVERTQVLLTRLIGENIELTVLIEPELWNVKADPGQIEQVLLNLAVNARDAMAQGGHITIEARNVEMDASYVEEHQQVTAGSYVMLAVEDTGSGMDHATQARIFDPFFTTKELGKGTGLGLATVYGIVKQSGGYIWVYSELGHGTTFKVYLPRVESAAEPVKNEESGEGTFGGSETILLAEDSASLREMTRDYLESVGYKVLEAVTGRDALDRSKIFAGTIHLLLTDVVMPGMSGPELAQQIGRLRPEIKIIFTSGYTDDAIVRHGGLDPAIAFIQKPYRPKALARKIREVLEVQAGNVITKS
ncbi:MAG TPA: PAS domain S-box protein [Candidatus Acidoferrum sp.]|nr:PAS domain S-box protein [Candidatus Acidoferrum sp.]